METVLKFLIKIATALVAVGFGVVGFLSLANSMHPLLAVVSFMLAAFAGFFTYLDVRSFLQKR